MSKLTELWKSISTTLHLPELAKPLWEQIIKQVDDHEERLAKLETTSTSGLPADLVDRMKKDWQQHLDEKARYEAEAAARVVEQEAAMVAIAKAAEDAAASENQAEGEKTEEQPAGDQAQTTGTAASDAGESTGTAASST